MRIPVLLLAVANLSWCRTAYDCRYFDCVTPFLEGAAVPLPPGSAIPQPAGWPGQPLTFFPVKATATGFVFGYVSEGGSQPEGPFLTDGTDTRFSLNWPDFRFIDLSDHGVILAEEVNDSPFLSTLQGFRQQLGPVFDSGFEYIIGASGRTLAMNDAGNAFLVTGVVKLQNLNPNLPRLVEGGLTMLWSDGFQPTAIPEPTTASLLLAGSLVGLISLRRRQRTQRMGA